MKTTAIKGQQCLINAGLLLARRIHCGVFFVVGTYLGVCLPEDLIRRIYPGLKKLTVHRPHVKVISFTKIIYNILSKNIGLLNNTYLSYFNSISTHSPPPPPPHNLMHDTTHNYRKYSIINIVWKLNHVAKIKKNNNNKFRV